MLLFMNIFITNQRTCRTCVHDDRLNIFKYQLASLSVIPWDKVVIYCALDAEYYPRLGELRDWVSELFPCNAEFYAHRNLKQWEWREAVNKVTGMSSDGLIWLLANDDHIFMAPDLSVLNEGIDYLKEEEGFKSLYFSHWPENMRWFAGRNANRKGRYLVTERHVTDGIQIVSESLLRAWLFNVDYGDIDLRRSDNFRGLFAHKCYLPLQELVYHMEGYMHVGIPFSLCPVLRVPPGFFDKDIKIAYCHEKKREGWVNIDPRKSFDETDCRMLMSEIPLFWRDRISEVSYKVIDHNMLVNSRKQHAREVCSFKPNSVWANESDAVPPEDWFREIDSAYAGESDSFLN